MGHYDECYAADEKEKAKERHNKVKKELIELINNLNDDEREILIDVVKNIKTIRSTIEILKKMLK